MSNIFQSTKSIDTIGFMGFGFKTIYKRFTDVLISDQNGWKFKFCVGENELILNENITIHSRDWLGAVTPIWDESIELPSNGFTTKFVLEGVTFATKFIPVARDVDVLYNNTNLCILCLQGLTNIKLEINKETIEWDMNYRNGMISLSNEDTENYWRIYEHKFIPTDDAAKSLCESRLKNILATSQNISEIWSSIKKEYSLYGIIPSNRNMVPTPNWTGGNIYATLPLASSIPFDINIQGPWLLDLARTGLRDYSSNHWQAQLISESVGLLVDYLKSITEYVDPETIKSCFDILENNNVADSINMSSNLWVHTFRTKIENVEFIPILTNNGSIDFKRCQDVILLPSSQHPIPILSDMIFGKFIVNRGLMNQSFINYLVNIKAIQEVDIEYLIDLWEGNYLQLWWGNICTNNRNYLSVNNSHYLYSLWLYLGSIFPRRDYNKLNCILTSDMDWVSLSDISVLEYKQSPRDVPSSLDNFGKSALTLLADHLPSIRLPAGWVTDLIKKSGEWGKTGRGIYDWISKSWKKVSLNSISKEAMKHISEQSSELIIEYTGWCINNEYYELVDYIVATKTNDYCIVQAQDCLLEEPYYTGQKSECRRKLFSDSPSVSDAYNDLYIEQLEKFVAILEERSLGKFSLSRTVSEKLKGYPEYNETKKYIAKKIGVLFADMEEQHTTRKDGWTIYDIDFPPELTLNNESIKYLYIWLENGIEECMESDSCLYVEGYNRRLHRAKGCVGSATWIKKLNEMEWIPDSSNTFFKPSEISIHEAKLSKELIQTLLEKGVNFKDAEKKTSAIELFITDQQVLQTEIIAETPFTYIQQTNCAVYIQKGYGRIHIDGYGSDHIENSWVIVVPKDCEFVLESIGASPMKATIMKI
eukprot:TRINITY_DN1367_c0_g1_i1.p1 TRINITY_DN1367_c0_g1~~TRINITY_DN1367_c0_g1_i1.p1  ORF type:complete len:875 (-),score=177.10 TRINITY_DN1367_c0_g1_i1:57-2681(-)